MEDKVLIWLCAFRYALGRKTYIVGTVTDYLTERIRVLSELAKKIIIQEITEAEGDTGFMGLGREDDKVRWLALRKKLQESLFPEEEVKND